MSSAWLFQRPEQVREVGEGQAAWYVGWYEPDGRRRKKAFGPGARGRRVADDFRRKVEGQLMTGTYMANDRKLWADFRTEYETRVVPGLRASTAKEVKAALDHFTRIVKPIRVFPISTGHVDEFIAARRQEPGRKGGDRTSPATVNKDLRHLRAALAVAVEWGYLRALPRFRMESVPKRLPRYVTPEHFAAMYRAADGAKYPAGLPNVTPGDWWRALLVMGYLTGWRIGDMLALRRDCLDLAEGVAVSLAEDNKGKRDERIDLPAPVVEHLRRLTGFAPVVFEWNLHERTLHSEFLRVQEAAGIRLPCRGTHKHTRYCHVYGFHDLRRAYATMNADKLTPDALQALMRHKSYQTTQVYINYGRQLKDAVAKVYVPEFLKGPAAESASAS